MVITALNHKDKSWTKQKKLRQALNKELIEVRQTTNKGRGLFALASFSVGEVICPLDGFIIEKSIHEDTLTTEQKEYVIISPVVINDMVQYLMPNIQYKGWHCINHSCTPNAGWGIKQTSFKNDNVIATQPININDELTTHYGWDSYANPNDEHQCMCDSVPCYGKIEFPLDPIRLKQYIQIMYSHRNIQALMETLGNLILKKNISEDILGDMLEDQQLIIKIKQLILSRIAKIKKFQYT